MLQVGCTSLHEGKLLAEETVWVNFLYLHDLNAGSLKGEVTKGGVKRSAESYLITIAASKRGVKWKYLVTRAEPLLSTQSPRNVLKMPQFSVGLDRFVVHNVFLSVF